MSYWRIEICGRLYCMSKVETEKEIVLQSVQAKRITLEQYMGMLLKKTRLLPVLTLWRKCMSEHYRLTHAFLFYFKGQTDRQEDTDT